MLVSRLEQQSRVARICARPSHRVLEPAAPLPPRNATGALKGPQESAGIGVSTSTHPSGTPAGSPTLRKRGLWGQGWHVCGHCKSHPFDMYAQEMVVSISGVALGSSLHSVQLSLVAMGRGLLLHHYQIPLWEEVWGLSFLV